jgi:hypothetical protein
MHCHAGPDPASVIYPNALSCRTRSGIHAVGVTNVALCLGLPFSLCSVSRVKLALMQTGLQNFFSTSKEI